MQSTSNIPFLSLSSFYSFAASTYSFSFFSLSFFFPFLSLFPSNLQKPPFLPPFYLHLFRCRTPSKISSSATATPIFDFNSFVLTLTIATCLLLLLLLPQLQLFRLCVSFSTIGLLRRRISPTLATAVSLPTHILQLLRSTWVSYLFSSFCSCLFVFWFPMCDQSCLSINLGSKIGAYIQLLSSRGFFFFN